MSTYLFVAVIITCIAALIGTLFIAKDISSKQKQYEMEGDSLENEINRSHEYETKSLTVNIKSLTWIYVALSVVIIITIIGILVY